MAKQKQPQRPALTCDGLGDLNNGGARLAIDQALLAAIKDLDERGHDEKARSVTITINMVKKQELAVVFVDAVAKLPAYRTGLTACKLVAGDQPGQMRLEFQRDAADNPDQPSMYEGEEEEGHR